VDALTGGDLVCQALLGAGVDTIFGYPGGAIMPFYDALLRHPLRHVLVRHESAAGFAADGYARVRGGVGVCVVTSGPGATNLATPLASAFMDSIPVVAITGQVNSWLVGTDAFQETDITGMFHTVTKWCTLVSKPEELAMAMETGIATALSGRPGPVLIDICKDVQAGRAIMAPVPAPHPRPARGAARLGLDSAALDRAGALINASTRPVILAGHGVMQAGAEKELRQLAERWHAPVATTLLGLGCFPEDHPLSLGMMGMHGDVHVNRAIDGADLLLAVGMRFDDRVTGNPAEYARNARLIHVELDPAEVGKVVRPDVALVCDARDGLRALASLAPPAVSAGWKPAGAARTNQMLLEHVPEDCFIAPQAMTVLDQVASDDAVVVTDVGQHQMWQAQHFTHRDGRRLLTSGGAGAMGYALGAAIGAKLAAPSREVWVVVGDGGFQMASAELATLQQEDLDIKVLVINNGYLGMVRQWQELFFERRYSFTRLSGPNLCRLAEAHGMAAFRATDIDNARRTLVDAKHLRGPVLVDLQVLAEDNVYPMIAPGKPISEMIVKEPSVAN
jgi:acetolactate synthase-1/2/3 large subunit